MKFDAAVDEISKKRLEAFFHVPLDAAAKELRVSPTFFKKLCRHHNVAPRLPPASPPPRLPPRTLTGRFATTQIAKWPYRSVMRMHTAIERAGGTPDLRRAPWDSGQRRKYFEYSKVIKPPPSPTDRVALWDALKRRKLAGACAPLPRNLARILSENPHYELYDAQDYWGDFAAWNLDADSPPFTVGVAEIARHWA